MRLTEDEHSFYSALYDCYTYFFRPGLKKDALELLKYLKRRRKKVAVFSDAKKYRLYTETRKSGATEYIDLELSSEAIRYYKPHPAGLLLIMDRFKVSRKRTLYVGDAASDILTAQFAGVDGCGIADGIETYEGLKAARRRSTSSGTSTPSWKRCADRGKAVGGPRATQTFIKSVNHISAADGTVLQKMN